MRWSESMKDKVFDSLHRLHEWSRATEPFKTKHVSLIGKETRVTIAELPFSIRRPGI